MTVNRLMHIISAVHGLLGVARCCMCSLLLQALIASCTAKDHRNCLNRIHLHIIEETESQKSGEEPQRDQRSGNTATRRPSQEASWVPICLPPSTNKCLKTDPVVRFEENLTVAEDGTALGCLGRFDLKMRPSPPAGSMCHEFGQR